jgi:hypothetical protein
MAYRMATKIVKAAGATADEFELSVAQELSNLEVIIIIDLNFNL